MNSANLPRLGLSQPYGVAVDGSGNIYIADVTNNRVLKVLSNDPTPLAIGLVAMRYSAYSCC